MNYLVIPESHLFLMNQDYRAVHHVQAIQAHLVHQGHQMDLVGHYHQAALAGLELPSFQTVLQNIPTHILYNMIIYALIIIMTGTFDF